MSTEAPPKENAFTRALKHPVLEAAIEAPNKSAGDTPVLPILIKTDDAIKPPAIPPKTEPVDADIPEKLRSESWAKDLNKAKREAQSKVKELEMQLADFEGTRKERDDLKKRVEDAEKERDSLRKAHTVSSLEMDSGFQKKYSDGKNKRLSNLKELASLGDIDADQLVQAVGKTGKEGVQALEEILSTAPSVLKADILDEVKAIRRLDDDRKAELSDAETSMSRRMQERTQGEAAEKEKRNKQRLDAWERVVSKLSKEYGVTDDQVKETLEFFKNNHDPEKAAEKLIKAAAADVYKTKNAELEAELEAYRTGDPGVHSGGRGSKSPEDAKLTMSQAIIKRYHSR